MKKLRFSVAICTKNRPREVRRLLRYIKNQTFWPDEIVLVENVDQVQYFDRQQLETYFANKIKIQYYSVKDVPIGFSRNLALKKTTQDYLIFIDDDIHLLNRYLFTKVQRRMMRFPQVAIWVGPVLSSVDTYWAKASEALYSPTNWLSERHKKTRVNFTPSSFLIINLPRVRNQKINFDETLDTHEDLDFTFQLFKKNEILIFDNSLLVWHDFAPSFTEFLRKQSFYSKNSLKIAQRYPNELDHFAQFYPKRKLQVIFLPIFISFNLVRNSFHCVKNGRNKKRFFWAFLIRELVYFSLIFKDKKTLEYFLIKFKNPFIHKG